VQCAATVFDGGVHVIVVGCGRVGSGLGLSLVSKGHSVAIIDKRATAFRRLPEDFLGQKIVGLGFDRDDLEAAGATRAGALAAVTSGDNSNILTARIARETYEIPAVVARIYDPRRAEIYQRVGIPTVATVTWTIDHVERRLFPEHSVTEWSDEGGGLRLIEKLLPPSSAGRRLVELEVRGSVRLISITRAGTPLLMHRDLVGQEGDIVRAMVTGDGAELFEAGFATPAGGEQ
jgi:trk system potassium uptake protein TrkA